VAATDLISLGIGGDTTAPIAYFITYGLGNYGGGPPPTPPEPGRPQGNLGFGPVVHTDEYYRELEDRRQRKRAVTERIVEEVGEESARVFVEQAKVDARKDEPLPPPNVSGLGEIYRALVELERSILYMEAREAQDREARRRQDDEDAILALLMA
jgi:hypothetical protein